MKFALALLWCLHWLPLPILGRLAKWTGRILYRFMPSRRHVTLTNLKICFPEWSEEKREQVAKEHFQYFSRALFERSILWWASEERLQKLIKIEPKLPVEEFKAGPVIILCPHFVCLDVAGAAIAMRVSASSMYMNQKNPVFDEALRKGRARFRPVKLFSRKDGIKPVLRTLKEGLPFFMLPDMDFGLKNSAFVPFFGTPASTLTALPRLAAASGAKVIPVVASFLPNYQGWKVTFYPEWENYPAGKDMIEATRYMNEYIEKLVRERPAEYFWAHRRFKTRPEGEENLY